MASSSRASAALSLPDIIENFLSDLEVKGVISETDLKEIINVQDDWVKLVSTALEYQGFNPRVIMSQLIRNRKSYEAQKNSLIQWDLANDRDNLKWTPASEEKNRFSNQESFSKDINFLIRMFLATNNHIGKIIKKARGGVDDILNMLKEKYVIDDNIHKSGTSQKSRITLPRIVKVFPGTAVRMFHEKSVKEIVAYEIFPGSLKPDTHAICCPLLPSVCPNSLVEEKGNNFHPVMIWTAIKLDDIIHRKDKVVTPLIKLLIYYRARYQSTAVPEKARIAIFKLFGLITIKRVSKVAEDIMLTENAKALVSSCHSTLGQMRTDDKNHDLMMKVAKTGDMTLF
ncbi:uncharacterized protein LOC131843220 [Achroia grisella]|uniref:uncharacterized protein LOC131843220 n=1 Tax=Achroia grisella TaxID=688607 RepID=UPI0027D32553|nr:uncharacterized protein LOC131843220 [Achroia grisella]